MNAAAVQINVSLAKFNEDLRQYRQLAQVTVGDALTKQGIKFTFELSRRLAAIKDPKGKITAENLLRMKSATEGIKVRGSLVLTGAAKNLVAQVNGKKLKGAHGLTWWQLAVKKELALRERARGFIAFATRYKGFAMLFRGDRSYSTAWRDRYSRTIAYAGLQRDEKKGVLTFSWGGAGKSADVATGLSRPKLFPLIAQSLDAVAADMREYIERKLNEMSRRLGN